jgi:hypothetical protein
MFEIGIISIIVLAVGYWVTLWLMGRHDDVLHGDFVHLEEGAEASAAAGPAFPSPPPFPARPPFPAKPVVKPFVARLAVTKPVATDSAAIKSAVAKPTAAPPLPAPPAAPAPTLSERSDTLQTLLASIKQDLKDASQL